MSGIQFSSPVTNQKASPAVYASSLATRPSPQLPGRIFVDTDDPSTGMYRDTGTVWVQISLGTGSIPDLQTVCNVGFLTDTDMTFLYDNSLNTSKIGFFNQDVGDFTFDIFKQANELFSIRALKPSTVDEEMELIFDAPGNTIKTRYNSIEQGISLNFINNIYRLGNFASGTATQRGIYIDAIGEVGIGNQNPTYLLDVTGTTRVSGTELRLDNGTTGTINIYSATPKVNFFSGGGYSIGRTSTTLEVISGGTIIQYIGANQAYQIDATNGHLFKSAIAGSASLARLTTGGNFMVGTTTDGGQRFQVNGTTRLTGDVTIVTTTNARQITFENSTLRAGVNISQPNNTLTFNNGAGFELNSQNVSLFTSGNTYFKGFQGSATFSYVNTSNVAAWSTLPDATVPYAWGRKLCLTGGTTITVPNASAILDIQSTTMGFLPPRMTRAEVLAIVSPAPGLMAYATDVEHLCFYNPTGGWQKVNSANL